MVRRASQPARRANGFTLIEAIAAVSLLSVCIPTLLLALAEAKRSESRPVLVTRASFLAEERMEDVLGDLLCESRGYAYLTSAHYPNEAQVVGATNFRRTTTIQVVGADGRPGGSGFKLATVQVSWTDAGRKTRHVSRTALFPEGAP